MKRFVLIPVLNEVQNIQELVSRLQKVLENSSYSDLSYVFIDGGSGDGTVEAIENITANNQNFEVIHQNEKRGLGQAYSQAISYALERGAEVIVTMDGDLQHRPEDIPRFLSLGDEGYEYVIGSRFIDGGAIPEDWGFERKLLSLGGNQLARLILNQFTIRDITSGYALFSGDILRKFNFENLYSFRHAYKIHLLYFMVRMGARTKEIPIRFDLRHHGDSKLITNDIYDTLQVLFRLRCFGP